MNKNTFLEFSAATRSAIALSGLAKMAFESGGNITLLDSKVKSSGYILLDSGIEEFALEYALPVEIEPAESGEFAFKVIRIGGVEILQVDENYSPEEGDG